MSAAVGTDDKKSVNVDLNIVPFIDLMSCLTAFLLVTAVWVNIARVSTHIGGRARDMVDPIDPDPTLSVLVDHDEIWVGVSRVDDFTKIPRDGNEWVRLEATLREQKKSIYAFAKTGEIEVAALSTA